MRNHGIDRVKGIAALCVVAIHSQRFFVGRTDLAALIMTAMTEWAVPAFFFVGGYVRARTTPYPTGTTRRWLARLLPPYVLASLLAFVVRGVLHGTPPTIPEVVHGLAAGSAFGIFYFVPMFLGVLLFSHVTARWPRTTVGIAAASVASLVLVRWDVEWDPFWRIADFYGIVRSPLFWWGYFFAGWIVRQRIEPAVPRTLLLRSAAAVSVAAVMVMTLQLPVAATAVARVAASIGIPLTILLWSSRRPGTIVATFGEYSYEVYLFHYFAITILHELGYSAKGVIIPLAVWILAAVAGLVAGMTARRALSGVVRAT